MPPPRACPPLVVPSTVPLLPRKPETETTVSKGKTWASEIPLVIGLPPLRIVIRRSLRAGAIPLPCLDATELHVRNPSDLGTHGC